jgi:hypothetical protein
MVEVIWTEIDKEGKDVEKRKNLKNVKEANEFVASFEKKDNYIELVSYTLKMDDWDREDGKDG